MLKTNAKVQHSFFMKRADNLFEQITDLENLKLAYLKVLKGKRYTSAVLIYGNKVDENLYNLKVKPECEKIF